MLSLHYLNGFFFQTLVEIVGFDEYVGCFSILNGPFSVGDNTI